MNGSFFTKQSFLFNYLSFILLHYDFKPVDAQCSIVCNKIFQNDELDEGDEHETDGDEMFECCENSEGFTAGAMFK